MRINKNLISHLVGVCTICVSFLMLYSSGVQKKIVGQAKFEAKKDDLFAKESLRKLIKNNRNTTIVVRNLVGSYSALKVSGGDPGNSLINILEKVFTKNDFIVRDRALFEKSFNQSGATDYSKMKDLTDTDLILELVEISNVPYVTNSYYKNGRLIKLPSLQTPLSYNGTKIELKIIKVKENDIVGTYTFYDTPCSDGCNVYKYLKQYYAYDPTNYQQAYALSFDETRWEVFTENVAKKLIASMKE
jgi:hypothetical protein